MARLILASFFGFMGFILPMHAHEITYCSTEENCEYEVSCPDPCCPDPCCWNYMVEVRAAYYYPLDSRFRKIYGKNGIYNLEISLESWWNLYPFLSVGYTYSDGHSIGDRDKTNIWFVPIDLGVKYLFCCDSYFRPYLGVGASFTYMKTKNDSPYVIRTNDKWGVGLVAKGGLYYMITECLFFDFFVDYNWTKMDFDYVPKDKYVLRHNADISRIMGGIGIGWSF